MGKSCCAVHRDTQKMMGLHSIGFHLTLKEDDCGLQPWGTRTGHQMTIRGYAVNTSYPAVSIGLRLGSEAVQDIPEAVHSTT